VVSISVYIDNKLSILYNDAIMYNILPHKIFDIPEIFSIIIFLFFLAIMTIISWISKSK